ncbi:acyltransferase [Nitratidesulfovibrio liaohensis]|uniref:Acyltransferase n=1 Tax=Nitratidesulfovibrio liaohensis TaxID=2604158 RepID=A0ABY9R393_9BACT|nr:acyltransferase [Nitratidesulfovibrio liaohensis]WMW66236.1 acyltransferase [Nitratidesulfovibrio liaohensis]
MGGWAAFKVAIRKRETPFHARLYDMAKFIFGISMPVVPGLHSFLYNEWATRTSIWHNFWRVVYYEPMFKSQCRRVGKNFRMWYSGNGTTRILGNLGIYIGDNVAMFDKVSLVGLTVYDDPELHIGNNVYIAPFVRFMVAKRIDVGDYSMVGCHIIMDNSGHPVADARARMMPGGGHPSKNGVRPVRIGALCFLGEASVIYPGTTVGDGVVAKVGTHIMGEIPPFCLIEGNPCRIVGKLPINDDLAEVFGEERVQAWRQAQDAVVLDA